jgi:hypothetical protein
MLGILDRESELALQTGVAHSMTTCELDGLVDREVIVHAHEAIDPEDALAKSIRGYGELTSSPPCVLERRPSVGYSV